MMGKDPEQVVAAGLLLDAAIVGSVASVAYGGWLVYPPAGFIVGGLLTLALALGLAAGASKNIRTTTPPRSGSRE